MNTRRMAALLAATLAMALAAACGQSAGKTLYNDGVYEGSSELGMHGTVTVQATVAKGRLAEIKATSANETQGIGTVAIDKLAKAMVEKQSAEVETVSGATMTSKAFIEAGAAALAKAKK